MLPDSAKLILSVGSGAYLVVFVALPILTLVLPPLLIGGFAFYKGNKFLRQRESKRRWALIGDSSLLYTSPPSKFDLPTTQTILDDLNRFSLNVISDKIWSNDQGMQDYFNIDIYKLDKLKLGNLEALQYEYNVSDARSMALFTDDYRLMMVQLRTLYYDGVKIATVYINVALEETPEATFDSDPALPFALGQSVVAIELVPLGWTPRRRFLINSGESFEGQSRSTEIKLKGHTRNL